MKSFKTLTHKHKKSPYLSGGSSFTFILFLDSEVTVLEEHVLLDFPTLLSTVGGIVGVFLGWSLLDLSWWLCKGVEKIAVKRMKIFKRPGKNIS